MVLGEFVVLHGSGSSGTTGVFVYSRTDWSVMNGVMAGRLPPPENAPAGKTRVAFYRLAHSHLASAVSAGRMAEQLFDVVAVLVLDPPERVIDQLERFQPHRLTGNSSSIANLAEWALEGRLHIQPGRIFAIGDLLTPGAAARIRQAWQAPIVDHYGASESLFLGLRTSHDEPMALMEELNVFEILADGGRPANLPTVAMTSFYAFGLERAQFVSCGPGQVHVHYVAGQDIDREVGREFARILAMMGASRTAFTVRRVPLIAPDPSTNKVRLVAMETPPTVTAGAARPAESAQRVEAVRQPELEPQASRPPQPPAFSRAEIDGSIVARFERQFRIHADRPAVRSRGPHPDLRPAESRVEPDRARSARE